MGSQNHIGFGGLRYKRQAVHGYNVTVVQVRELGVASAVSDPPHAAVPAAEAAFVRHPGTCRAPTEAALPHLRRESSVLRRHRMLRHPRCVQP